MPRYFFNVVGLDGVPRVTPTDVPDTASYNDVAAMFQQQQRGRIVEVLHPTQNDLESFSKIPVVNLESSPLPSVGEQVSGSAPTPPPPQGQVTPGMTWQSRVPAAVAGTAVPALLAAGGVTANPLLLGAAGVASAAGLGAPAGNYIQNTFQPERPNIPLSQRALTEARDQGVGEVLGYGAGRVLPRALSATGEGLMSRGETLAASHTLPPAPVAPVMTPIPKSLGGPTLFDAAGNKIITGAEEKATAKANRIAAANAKKQAAYLTDKNASTRMLQQRRLEGAGPGFNGGLLGLNMHLSDLSSPMTMAGQGAQFLARSPAASLAGRGLLQSGIRARYSQAPGITNQDELPAF